MTTAAADLVTPTGRLVLPATEAEPGSPGWLAARRAGIGSSDVAAILGVDPWSSPYALWLDKTGADVREREETEPMFWGKVLEGPIAEEYARRHDVVVQPTPGVLAHVDRPWQLANPDRMLAAPDDPRPFSFVEVKNVSAWKAGEWDAAAGLLPMHYLAQVLWQLGVTGYDEAAVACLVGGQHFESLTVHRDDELLAVLLDRAEAFWRLVQSGTAPDWDGSPQSVAAVKRLRAQAGKVVELDGRDDALALLDRVRAAKALVADAKDLLKRREAVADEAVGALCAVLGDAEVAVLDGEPVCTWKTTSRKSYVVKACEFRTFRLVEG